VDHVSSRFGVDEVVSMNGCDVTLQWSIIAWGLENAGHRKGSHSKGLLSQGAQGCGISLLRNVLAHANDRMPDVEHFGSIQIVNNVFHNADAEFGEIYASDGEIVRVNYTGNVVQAGPATSGTVPPAVRLKVTERGALAFYESDNIVPPEGGVLTSADKIHSVQSSHEMPVVIEWIAMDVVRNLVPAVGASVPLHDIPDHILLSDVLNSTGNIIDDPANISLEKADAMAQLEDLAMACPCVAPPDNDDDGIPDPYEAAHPLLEPTDGADGALDLDGDGYSELENWLSSLAARRTAPGSTTARPDER
jgi:hypothetical protein